jgi:hypothetical protein
MQVAGCGVCVLVYLHQCACAFASLSFTQHTVLSGARSLQDTLALMFGEVDEGVTTNTNPLFSTQTSSQVRHSVLSSPAMPQSMGMSSGEQV